MPSVATAADLEEIHEKKARSSSQTSILHTKSILGRASTNQEFSLTLQPLEVQERQALPSSCLCLGINRT